TIDQLYQVYCESDAEAWRRVPRGTRLTAGQLHEAVETLRTLPLPADKNWQKARAKDLAAVEEADWDCFIKNGIAGKVAGGEPSYCRKPITPEVQAAYEPL